MISKYAVLVALGLAAAGAAVGAGGVVGTGAC